MATNVVKMKKTNVEKLIETLPSLEADALIVVSMNVSQDENGKILNTDYTVRYAGLLSAPDMAMASILLSNTSMSMD